jgi:hypothetical protein
VLLVLSALVGALLGLFMSSIPRPSDDGTFYVGNFSAPWAVLAFGVGWAQRSKLSAVLGGVAAEVACLVGFYGQSLIVWFEDPGRLLGRDPYPGLLQFTETAVTRWLSYLPDLIGPWLVMAIGAGIVYGLLGRWWGRSRSIVAGAALALPFFAEPFAWRMYGAFPMGPLAVWVVEIGVGIALLGLVLVLARRRTSATGALTQPPEPRDSSSAGIRDY